MAADILSVYGNTSGTQVIGNVSVFAGGAVKTSTTHVVDTIEIASITGKYDTRFDDPTYY